MDPDFLPPNFPLLLFDRHSSASDNCSYRIISTIGTFAGGRLKVYRAVVINPARGYYDDLHVEDIFVTVKCLNAGKDREYTVLRREAELNKLLPDHENIIRIRRPFFTPNDYYCVVFPHMGMGSVRHILRTKFPDGMPQDLILVVLREALKGLSYLHHCDRVHGQFNAANIFLSRKPSIQLSFSATLFTPTEDQDLPAAYSSSSSALPMSSICTWAAAPEAYDQHPSRYTAKADVWMVGITALELACGGLHRVPDRKTLENIVQEIIKKRKFPKEVQAKKNSFFRNLLGRGGPGAGEEGPHPVQYVFTKGEFSRKFQEMVASCLEWNYKSRPTVEQVLVTDVMRENPTRAATYFYERVIDLRVTEA